MLVAQLGAQRVKHDEERWREMHQPGRCSLCTIGLVLAAMGAWVLRNRKGVDHRPNS